MIRCMGAALILLAGCNASPGPEDRIWMPSCIFFCKAAVSEAKAHDQGNASAGDIHQEKHTSREPRW